MRARRAQARERAGQLSLTAMMAVTAGVATPEALADRLASAVGAAGHRARIAFEMMHVAEELLAARWPGRAGEPRIAFRLLCATQPVLLSVALYRAHASELVERLATQPPEPWTVADWQRLARITRAEQIGILFAASARHPLRHGDLLIYETLFRQCFPDALPGHEWTPMSADAAHEVEHDIAERLAAISPERGPDLELARADARKEAA